MEKKKTQKSTKKSTTKKTTAKKTTATKKSAAKKTVVKKVAPVVEAVNEVKEKVNVSVQPKRDHSLFKVLVLAILVVVVLTWIIPSGSFNGAEFVASTRVRTGLNELFLSIFYGANYYLIQLFVLLVIGAFYGVVSKTNGYSAMINTFAKMWKGKEKLFVLVNSLIIALMTSCFTHPFAVLAFIPMIYSVAKKLNISKISAMMMTFGSMLVGLMGTTYGTYGIDYLVRYMGVTSTTLLGVRFGVLAIGFLALNVFVILMEKKNKNSAKVNEMFEVVEGKGKGIGFIITFAILFIVSILAFVPFESIFETTVFTDFHTWLTTKITVGEHPICGYILGNIPAFASWDLFNLSAVLLFIMIVCKFTCRVKWDEVLDRAIEGIRVMVKPMVLTTFAYAMFVICYWSGMTSNIINFLNSTANFNPYLNALGNGLATLFHVDFGYSGFALGTYYAAKSADKVNSIMLIMISMNGLVSFIAPTSVIMLVGLSLSKISYKEWAKYIWKFLVAMLVILFIIYTLI